MSYSTGLYHLGSTSSGRLSSCHPLLIVVIRHSLVMSPMDFAVECGFRGQAAQNKAFVDGASTKQFPDSWHNHESDAQDVKDGFATIEGAALSMAVDVVPFLYGRKSWNRPKEARWLNGFIIGVGMPLVFPYGFYLRSGDDWDMDGDHEEHTLKDSPHIELRRFA